MKADTGTSKMFAAVVFPQTPKGSSSGKRYEIYAVSNDGGIPEQLIRDDSGPQTDPNWSPDGSKIVFAGGVVEDSSTIRVLALGSHQISTLPQIPGILLAPLVTRREIRCRPDLRHAKYCPLRFPDTEVVGTDANATQFPKLVSDWKYAYFLRVPQNPAVLRVRISDRKVQDVADLKNFPSTGYFGTSLALTPDDSPLLLRNTGTQDVFALDWQAP